MPLFAATLQEVPQLAHRLEAMRNCVFGLFLHFGVGLVALPGLEAGVPSKPRGTAGTDNSPSGDPLKELHGLPTPLAKGKGAHSLRLVVTGAVSEEHLVQT